MESTAPDHNIPQLSLLTSGQEDHGRETLEAKAEEAGDHGLV